MSTFDPQRDRRQSWWTSRLHSAAACIALTACCACSSKGAPREATARAAVSSAGEAAAAPGDTTYWVYRKLALTPAPAARARNALFFDAASGRSILFGGNRQDVGQVAETWAYDGTWTSCPGTSCTAAPSARSSTAVAYVPGRSVAVLFGGDGGLSGTYCDTWEWNGANDSWTRVSNPTCTAQKEITARRLGHAMAGFEDSAALFGGRAWDGSGYPVTNDLFVWKESAWSALCDSTCMSGSVPAPRGDATLTHVKTQNKNGLFLFGGQTALGYENDVWEYDLALGRWFRRCTSAGCQPPEARAFHGAVFDSVRGKLFVHGGCPNGNANCDPALGAAEYDPERDTWTAIPSPVDSPANDQKQRFGIAFDSKRRRIVEFGGFEVGQYVGRTVEYYSRGDSCTSDADCHTGACVKKAPTDATGTCAEACTNGAADNGTGPCVDGFRCNKACDQPCEICSAIPGVCTLSSGGPDDHCSGNNTCSTQGACLARNGQPCSQGALCASGICATHGEPVCSEQGCGTQPCVKARSDGSCVVARRGDTFDCDGNLTCGDNGQCLTSCERDADCAPGYFCGANKQCSIGKRFGEACTRSEECGRGNCSYGVCCAADCRNPCEKCGADGQCEFLKPEDPPRIPCGTGDCAGRCSGTSGLCDFPNSTKLCERADCPEGNCKTHCLEHAWVVEWACNGSGECVEGRPRACDNDFSCSNGKCSVECSSDEQCRRAATCDVTAQDCTPDGESCTDDGFQVKLKNGTVVDCKGYQCIGQGQCSEVCEDQTQCAEGYRCQRHRCEPIERGRDAGPDAPSSVGDAGVPPSDVRDAATKQPDPAKQPQPADDGCATAPGPHDWRGSALIASGLAWLYGRRRKRRHDHEA
jgi:hypothetical protein